MSKCRKSMRAYKMSCKKSGLKSTKGLERYTKGKKTKGRGELDS